MLDITQEGRNHSLLRDRLKDAYGLQDGDEALADTLDGISDFKELALTALREAVETEAMAEALKAMMADMKTRHERLTKKAEKIRAAVAWGMKDANEPKLVAPDMTVSLRGARPSIAYDIEKLPGNLKFPKIEMQPNKQVIKEMIEAGDIPEGVIVTPGSPSVQIRSK